jgi:hypothetical protein
VSWSSKSFAPPPGYQYGPTYRASWLTQLRTVIYLTLGRPRSLARDGYLVLRDLPAPPLVRGADCLPEHGPLVLVANHYERPGLWIAWVGIVVSEIVMLRTGQQTHWITIQEWDTFSIAGIRIPPRFIRWVFTRAFRVWDLLAMPPPGARARERAAAMREALDTVARGGIIGIMPEGDVGPTPELLPARKGAGSFLELLAHAGATVVPLGIFEEDRRIIVAVGSPLALLLPPEISQEDADASICGRAMRAIRDLLPEPLWGAYKEREGTAKPMEYYSGRDSEV